MSFPVQQPSGRGRARIILGLALLLGAGRAVAVSELDFGLEQHQVHRIVIEGN